MKKKIYLTLLLTGLLALAACGGDDEGNGELSDQELLDRGWNAFANGQLDQAVDNFQALVDRGALLAEAYSGLGWSHSRAKLPDEAESAFDSGWNQQPTGQLAADVQAGLAFVYDAQERYSDCLGATDQVPAGWALPHDATIDHNDLIVLRAVCYYALGDFANSLTEVQRLDAAFTADVNTPAGRAALADKIEALLL